MKDDVLNLTALPGFQELIDERIVSPPAPRQPYFRIILMCLSNKAEELEAEMADKGYLLEQESMGGGTLKEIEFWRPLTRKEAKDYRKSQRKMKIIDKSKEKDKEEWQDGDVIVAYNDDEEKQYFMLTYINDIEDGAHCHAIALNDSADNVAGTDEIYSLGNYGYCSYSDLVDDLKSRLDHVEKVHNPRLLVGGDDDD